MWQTLFILPIRQDAGFRRRVARNSFARGAADHQIVHGPREVLQIAVAVWMVGHGYDDVVSSRARDDGGVVKPILPPAGFAQQLQIAARQPFDELIREVWDVR